MHITTIDVTFIVYRASLVTHNITKILIIIAHHLSVMGLIFFLPFSFRPTLAFSASLSIHTGTSRFTLSKLSTCTVARDAPRCHPTSLPLRTTPTSTCCKVRWGPIVTVSRGMHYNMPTQISCCVCFAYYTATMCRIPSSNDVLLI